MSVFMALNEQRFSQKLKNSWINAQLYLKKLFLLLAIVSLTTFTVIDVWINIKSVKIVGKLNESAAYVDYEDYELNESEDVTKAQMNNGKLCEKIKLNVYINISKTPPTTIQAFQFIPHLRNPCWYEEYGKDELDSIRDNPYQYTVRGEQYINKFNSNLSRIYHIYKNKWPKGVKSRLRCIPLFYIIGQPKSGTTDLYKKLSFHPQIQRGLLKETHWWRWTVTGIQTEWKKYEVEFSHLVDLFSLAAIRLENIIETTCKFNLNNQCTQPIIGDGSAFTMDSAFDFVKTSVHKDFDLKIPKSVPQYIKWTTPNVKFIVLLREPVERLFSGYSYFNKQNVTKSQQDFHRLAEKAIQMFEECVRLNNSFANCSIQQRILTKKITLHQGLYALYLEEWFKVFDRKNFLILKMEDYVNNMRETLKKVHSFLEVCELSAEKENEIIKTKVFNSGKYTIGPMFNSTRQMLENFYKPFNERLAYMMNDSRFLWLS